MFENITFETIMERMLERVPSTADKREGSVIWDALAPAAVELQNTYIALDTVLNETFADTASLFYLKKRAAERGIQQNMATRAVLQGEFTPATMNVPVGSRFSCDEFNYTITEKIGDGIYKLECETAGREGNNHFGLLIPIDYIEGLETAELTELLTPAEDDESVEELRERYLNSISSQAYGGNIADYQEKTMSIDGVGAVKVIPAWNGGGTVKLIIMDSTFGAPNNRFVTEVQRLVDPQGYEGFGYGFAPIGHVVTVVGVLSSKVNITADIVYESGLSWEAAQSKIKEAVDNYFTELAKTWDSVDNLTVRISHLESEILKCEGVVDISDTKLNGSASNLIIGDAYIPIRGTINGN